MLLFDDQHEVEVAGEEWSQGGYADGPNRIENYLDIVHPHRYSHHRQVKNECVQDEVESCLFLPCCIFLVTYVRANLLLLVLRAPFLPFFLLLLNS